MVERTILQVANMSWTAKVFSIVIAFLTPLASLIHVLIILILVDAITSIYYQMRMAADKADKGKRTLAAISVIESSKLRKTIEKMFFYILTLIVFYSFDLYILQVKPITSVAIYTFSVTNLSAVLISIVEMTSIASNVSKITNNPIFNQILKITAKKINQKYELDENDTK